MGKHTEMEVELCAVKQKLFDVERERDEWRKNNYDCMKDLVSKTSANSKLKIFLFVSSITAIALLTALTLSVQ